MNHNTTSNKESELRDSRQMAGIGVECMTKAREERVLIIGQKSVGVEIARDLCLLGIGKLGFHDTTVIEEEDLAYNPFITQQDLGQNRVKATLKGLQELNPRVTLSDVTGLPIDKDLLEQYDVCVVTDFYNSTELEKWNKICRTLSKGFVFAGCLGFHTFTFVDYGEDFSSYDVFNAKNSSLNIKALVKGTKTQLTTYLPHQLQNGDLIMLRLSKGQENLGSIHYPVKVLEMDSVEVDLDLSGAEVDLDYAYIKKVNPPKKRSFKSISETLRDPFQGGCSLREPSQLDKIDPERNTRPVLLHLFLLATLEFYEKYGRLAWIMSDEDAEEIVQTVRRTLEINPAFNKFIDLFGPEDFRLISTLARWTKMQTTYHATFCGALTAHEVLKFTGFGIPIQQWLHFENSELLIRQQEGSIEHFPIGQNMPESWKNKRILLVGAGALGCEFLKLTALSNIASGPGGEILCFDDDYIENTNLSRQFLFRNSDIKQSKAEVVCRRIKAINPKIKCTPYIMRLCETTEKQLEPGFWNSVDLVIAAVDNIDARIYLEKCCNERTIPFFEAGLLGSFVSTFVSIPGKTSCYSDISRQAKAEVNNCTIKRFPTKIEHCVQWAKEIFEEITTAFPDKYNKLKTALHSSSPIEMNLESKHLTLKFVQLCQNLSKKRLLEFAKDLFEDKFNNQIADFISQYPLDSLDVHGNKFWNETRVFPKPVNFSSDGAWDNQFILAAAAILAQVLNVDYNVEELSQKDIKEILENYDCTVTGSESLLLEKELLSLSELKDMKFNNISFDKDDLSKSHIEFITAAANLRAKNYNIASIDEFNARIIAGDILPAMITSAALATSLLGFELLKFLNEQPVNCFRITRGNLENAFFLAMKPSPPKIIDDNIVGKDNEAFPKGGWTKWDQLRFKGPLKVGELITNLESQFGFEVIGVYLEGHLVYDCQTFDIEEKLAVSSLEIEEALSKERNGHVGPIIIKVTGLTRQKPAKFVDLPTIKYHMD